MNAEYQRLEAEASEVQNQIDGLVNSCGQMVAADFQTFEAKIAELHQRLAGIRQGMGLLKLAGSATMQAQAAKLAKSQPKTFHSRGTRPKNCEIDGQCHGHNSHHLLSSIPVPGEGKKQENESRHVSHADSARHRQWLHGGSAATDDEMCGAAGIV